jgi:hypothetical protein
VQTFKVDEDFVLALTNLVKARSQPGFEQIMHDIVSDYSAIVNYDPDLLFDQNLHETYLHHVPLQNFHGLTLDQIVSWTPGGAIVFPRTQLHCATATHKNKIGITIFTNHA